MSSLLSRFRAFTPLTRAAIGVSFLAWGTIGLYLSDTAEKKLGFEPKDEDREALGRMLPRLEVVDRDEERVGRRER